ncbi:MAG: dTMP kinase [bacterium]|nr:dTMP kinase [bacterium]
MNQTPLFIVFEGIDGSGKSTQVKMLTRYLESKNRPVKQMMEPTNGQWGRHIREILKGEYTPPVEEMFDLFIKDREDDAENNILPALNNNQSIIMDRYYYSNAAYQGAMGLSPDFILTENRNKNFPRPHRVYYIDIEPEEAMNRISGRNSSGEEREIFEKAAFLVKVREIYHSIAAQEDIFFIVDGSRSIDDIFTAIKNDVDTLLLK